MEFWLGVRNGNIDEATFITDGCGSSLACGSMATILAKGKQIENVRELSQQDILKALGGLPSELEHCALLAVNTLKAACDNYVKNATAPSHDHTCNCLDEDNDETNEEKKLAARLSMIKHKIVVLSGKGGVGKSTIAVNLATSLMLSGKRVGLLDVDIHGPSIPTMLGLENQTIPGSEEGPIPVELGDLKIMSIGFLLKNQDQAVIWRGPMKMGVIKQFLSDVAWGDLDYLIINCPPGTGDEPLSVCQLIPDLDGAVIVTTPQKVAARNVRKSVTFCRELDIPIFGVLENMSRFACAHCGKITGIFCSGAGRQIAEEMGVTFLGAIPLDPRVAEESDKGKAYIHAYADSSTATAMKESFAHLAN